ncbi:MAG TPA: hypothetical protein VGE74_00595 [Gemmata sp.]
MSDSTGPTPTIRLGAPTPLPVELVSTGSFGQNVSPDGLAVSVLLGGTVTGLSAGPGADASVQVTTFALPVTVPDPVRESFLGYAAHLNLTVTKTAGVRVTVTLTAGGATRVLEYPFGGELSGSFREQLFAFERAVKEVPVGEQTTEAQFPAAPVVPAVLVVTALRRTADDSATVALDAIDIEVIDPLRAPDPVPAPKAHCG